MWENSAAERVVGIARWGKWGLAKSAESSFTTICRVDWTAAPETDQRVSIVFLCLTYGLFDSAQRGVLLNAPEHTDKFPLGSFLNPINKVRCFGYAPSSYQEWSLEFSGSSSLARWPIHWGPKCTRSMGR